MTRSLMIAVLLATTATAAAQAAGGPPIAYARVEGTSTAIYLARDDGSAAVKLTTMPAKRTICALDLKPGGGEIAYIECGTSVPRTLKVLGVSDSGAAIGSAVTISGLCSVDTVDYHPTQPKLIVSEICSGVARIAAIGTDGSGYQLLVSTGAYLNKARWLKDGTSYVYARAPVDGGPIQLCRNSCSSASNDLLWTGSGLTWLDVGRTTNVILFNSGGSFIHKLNADTGSLQTNFISGTDGHFSPNDTEILFETPHEARGDYLMIRRETGSNFRLTSKGEYGAKDWRN